MKSTKIFTNNMLNFFRNLEKNLCIPYVTHSCGTFKKMYGVGSICDTYLHFMCEKINF